MLGFWDGIIIGWTFGVIFGSLPVGWILRRARRQRLYSDCVLS